MKKGRKTLLLLTTRKAVADMYLPDLQKLFSNYLDLKSYSLEWENAESASNQMLHNTDILLLTSSNNYSFVREYLPESCHIIHLEYAFDKERIDLLKQLPGKTNCLVCFKFYQVSVHVVKLLRELGLKNLVLEPYDPSIRPPADGLHDVAIIGDNSANIPVLVKRVVSLGMRMLSFSTLIAIADAAGILDEQLEGRFYSYCKRSYTPTDFILDFYGTSLSNRIQFRTIMNCIDYAVIVCNKDYRVLDHNSNALSIFDVKNDLRGACLFEIEVFSNILTPLINVNNVENQLVELPNKKSLLFSKEQVTQPGDDNIIHILLMKDVTKIHSLEKSFKAQLAQRGYITKYSFSDIKGNSMEIRKCVGKGIVIAKIDKTTLIVGESGVGKELFAQSIHSASTRSGMPFVALNCAALPTSLLESELFGYTDGAFTGAKKGGRKGLFEMAHSGTLFLDEIGEISLETQAKLLRVLEEKEIMRIGNSEVIPVDVRVIAASNRNLGVLVRQGSFRKDLYYRLNMLILQVPPLRNRKEDIIPLTMSVLSASGFSHVKISPEVKVFLESFSWPGNVRELRNCVEYMACISDGVIRLEHLPEYVLEEQEEQTSSNQDCLYGISAQNRILAKDILQQLDYKSSGRRQLREALLQKHPELSEYRIRGLLTDLSSRGFLFFGKGRSGVSLTDAGRKALSAVLASSN